MDGGTNHYDKEISPSCQRLNGGLKVRELVSELENDPQALGHRAALSRKGWREQHGARWDGSSKGLMEKVVERKEQLEVLVRQEEQQLFGKQCAVFSCDPPIEVSRAMFKK